MKKLLSILLVLALAYFFSGGGFRDFKKRILIGVLLFVICIAMGNSNSFAFWQKDLTYEGESIYNYLQVYESPNEVVLSTNVLFGVQSVYCKEKSLTWQKVEELLVM